MMTVLKHPECPECEAVMVAFPHGFVCAACYQALGQNVILPPEAMVVEQMWTMEEVLFPQYADSATLLEKIRDIGYEVKAQKDKIYWHWYGSGNPDLKIVKPLIDQMVKQKAEIMAILRAEQITDGNA
jgi:hypothetical protein